MNRLSMLLRKLRIKTQLYTIAVLNVIIMLLITSIFYSKITYIYEQRNSEYVEEIIVQMVNTVSSNCNVINNLAQTIAYNSIVQEYLMETDVLTKYELYGNVSNLLENMKNINKGIIDIVLIGTNGNSFDTYGGAQFCKQIVDNVPERAEPYYSSLIRFEGLFVKRDSFFVGTKIYSINPNKNPNSLIGTLFIVVDSNSLLGGKNEGTEKIGAEIYCLDRNNQIFPSDGTEKSNDILKIVNDYLNDHLDSRSNNEEDPLNIKIYGKNYLVKTASLPYIEGKIVSIIPHEKLMHDIAEARKMQLIVFMVAVGILSILFAIVNNNIIQPIKKLMKFMKNINSENLKARVDLHGYNEVSIMAHEFNNMLDKIDRLTQDLVQSNARLYELELGKKQSELAYLRSQINPHFLYNTLESLKGIAAEEGIPRIMEMSKALARIFRYSIKGADTVPLEEEIDIVKSYLKIQQLRFGNRFDIIYDLDKSIMDCRVPKMILQPIVENAVFHGLETKLDKGHLYIGAKTYGDGILYIWVKDDGLGMDQDTFNKIHRSLSETIIKYNRKINNSDTDSTENIGLVNVNNRIKLAYGEEYGLSIYSYPGQGTEVIIKLPEERADG